MGQWIAKTAGVDYDVSVEIEAGETIDAIVDMIGSYTSDSFSNVYTITQLETASAIVWDSNKEFHGPLGQSAYELNATIAEQIAYGWQLAYGRPPTREEVQLSIDFIEQQVVLLIAAKNKSPFGQAMTNYCQALLTSNQFLYME